MGYRQTGTVYTCRFGLLDVHPDRTPIRSRISIGSNSTIFQIVVVCQNKNKGCINPCSFFLLKLTGYHSNVPWATAKRMYDLSSSPIYLPTLKFWRRSVWHIWRNMPDFSNFFHTHTYMSHMIYGVTGPKFTKFLHDVGQFTAQVTRPSASQYSILFWNASVPNEGKSANVAQKLAAMATSLKLSKKRVTSNTFNQTSTIWWKTYKKLVQQILR